ncbi:MAG: DUF2877 domain-containing protein [Nitrososphaeria archaeon]
MVTSKSNLEGLRNLKVLSIGCKAREMMVNERFWLVHSAFNHSFYAVSKKGGIICFVRNKLYTGPVNLVLAFPKNMPFRDVCVEKGNIMEYVPERLVVKDKVTFDLKHAKVWNSPIWRSKKFDLEKVKQNLSLAKDVCLKTCHRKGFGEFIVYLDDFVKGKNVALSCQDEVINVAFPHINTFIEGIRKGNGSLVKVSAYNLAGLGQGLTPSADDFMIGFVAAASIISKHYHLNYEKVFSINRGILSAFEEKSTTSISMAFLRLAVEGEAIGPIWSLIESIFTSKNIERSTIGLLRIGHSSGVDMFFGVVLSTSLLLESLLGGTV